MQNTVLILGARGRFGLATARAFADAGWRVVGQVRIAMEARLRASGVRAVVIRAGDFFGSGKGTWFDTAMVKDIHKGVFTNPGTPEVSRAWAYLPDLARTFVAVAQRCNTLTPYEEFHFAGHQIDSQRWTEVLTALIGPEPHTPHTPLAQAAEAALVDLGLMAASRHSTAARGPITGFAVQRLL